MPWKDRTVVSIREESKPAADLPKPDASADKPNALWTTASKGWWVTAGLPHPRQPGP